MIWKKQQVYVAIKAGYALAAMLAVFFTAAAGYAFQKKQSVFTLQTPLKPFKDRRFAYRTPLAVEDGGAFMLIPYDEKRDIHKRDEMPVRKVRGGFIRRIPKKLVHDFTYVSPNGERAVFGVGNVGGGSAITVIYLFGKNGNRKWGFDDERFGGNYNRLKNLALISGGAYLSPDFSDFEEKGEADIAALIARQRSATNGSLVLACGSYASKLCWMLGTRPDIAPLMDGMVFLGGFPYDRFAEQAFKRELPRTMPIYIAHGALDHVYSPLKMKSFYKLLHAMGYPVRMVIFNTGSHGTPVRMIDWRHALNWIASRR